MTQLKKFAVLPLLLLMTSCQAKEVNMTKQLDQWDVHYQNALSTARKLDSVFHIPCPVGKWGDYRYIACFRDLSGSTAQTMGQLKQVLTKAGFVQVGGDDSDLDSTFTLPGTPFTLNSTFDSVGIQWMAFQKDRGEIASRRGIDPPGAKYAVMPATQFTEMQAIRFLGETVPENGPARSYSRFAKTCDESSGGVSVCLGPLTREEIYNALSNLYVVDRQEFDRLNKQPTFTDADSKHVQEMIAQRTLNRGFVNPFTFHKVAKDHFFVLDTEDYPNYRLDYYIEKHPNGGNQVRITASALKASQHQNK